MFNSPNKGSNTSSVIVAVPIVLIKAAPDPLQTPELFVAVLTFASIAFKLTSPPQKPIGAVGQLNSGSGKSKTFTTMSMLCFDFNKKEIGKQKENKYT